jgi:serine/threonine-protein kinase
MMDLTGKTLGQYQVIRELGRGGMAVVYEAYQPALNRTVALKVLPPNLSADAAFVQRFLCEARAAARLEHPNIVAIYDVLDLKGVYCIVMQKLDGEPLHALLRRHGRLPLDRATRLLGQIASALDYAHERGIVHRDVKPANIVVGRDDHVWLTDFGIAQIITNMQPTQTRAIVGTPEHI